ncbi:MAG TPA: YihY/virulence factor BrkB family protein [Chloroflexota bacterium]|nr:YihY/virulence factor BrkB family protein [Chloroflexota bacterium]
MLEWRKQGERLWQLGGEWAGWLGVHGRSWLFITGQALQQTFGSDTGMVASSIGYYTLFSLFPLILLSVAIASLWVDPNVVESEIMHRLEFIVPGLQALLGQNIESIVNARAPITGIAVLILLWTASNIFTALTRAMDMVWGMELTWSRSAFRQRGLAMLIVLFTGIAILLASLYGGTVVAIVNSFYPETLRPYRPYTNELWTVLVSVGLFAMLYRFLPHRRLTWRDVLPGALIAGFTWSVVKDSFLSIIDIYLSRTNLVYGSVTTVIVFLTWTYVSSFIFLFGAHLNVAYVRQRLPAKTAGQR